ncbi:hsp70-like protein [Phytophthora cinnamomi]|uniref:hsp70-like protein n=1 Tax=Phytophthora cinnamomi TaxID=4785 RepID=UPI00355A86D8|nr:hsp70-like protein [Phytophthora cinnamomi]
MARDGLSVGIDLGTTCLRVGVHGATCWRRRVTRNVHNTVFGVSHLIGRKFSDPEVQEDLKHWPFKVVRGPDDKPQVVVQIMGAIKTFQPLEILAMMLAEARETVEIHLGKKVKNAVVTIPASFSYAQRQAIKDAGAVAGLNVARLTCKSTAAAIAHGLENKTKAGQRNVLVFDLGGGTLDVSLVAIEEEIYEVLGTAGSSHLGGEDVDARLGEHCVAEFKRVHHKDLQTNARAMMRLRMACEHAKRALFASDSLEKFIELDGLHEGIDFHTTITYAQVEAICTGIFDELLVHVQQVLSDASVLRSKVDEVVVVGGSTRIPKVRQHLAEFFNGKEVTRSIREEELNVLGATMQAAMITGELSVIQSLHEFMVLDDNQLAMRMQLCEGESEIDNVSNTHVLGKLEMDGIPPKPSGESKIEVSVEVDVNGSLTVLVLEESADKTKKLTINGDRLSVSEIERLKKIVAKDTSKLELENYANSVRSSAAKRIAELKRSIEEMQAVKDQATETLHWLNRNQSVERRDIDVKRRKLEEASTMVVYHW